jgi:carboxypeptidase Q
MRLAHSWPALLAAFIFVNVIPAAAQLSSPQPDPLARIREAASNTPACSATGESLCEQVAPKIIANAQGESPLAENLRRLTDEIGGGASGSPAAARVVAWAVAAFRNAGLDVHTEKFTERAGDPDDQENVVAEIRGREKPDEWVLLGAHLDSWVHGPGVQDNSCDAAAVIEAARDILLTGIRPRRSVRFVLFTGGEAVPGSWAYVRAHRAELDGARAAIILHSLCLRVTGYSLNGRHDIELGLREAMNPAESLGAGHYDFAVAPGIDDDFDFLLEGVPTLAAIRVPTSYVFDAPAEVGTPDKVAIADLKHNTAVVAVTAFGIAERGAPIGPRQSRAQINSLLKTSGLEQAMKGTPLWPLWPLWQSGERGRKP